MTALVAVLFLAAAAPAWAQDPALQERLRKSNVDAANAIQWEEGDQDIIFLTGGVSMKRPDMSLQAGRVMLWRNKDSKDQLYDEIYAEGNVIFARGPQKLTCERFFFSNLTKSGAIVDVRLKAYSKDLKSDFFAMAKEASTARRRNARS